MIYLFDNYQELLEVIKTPTSATMTRRINAPERLLVETDSSFYPIIEDCAFMGHFHAGRFYLYTLKRPKLDNNRLSLEGVSYAYDHLAGCAVIEDKRPQDVSASAALLSALEGTGWELGTIETTPLQSTSFYYITPAEAIQKIIETWQVELDLYYEFDGRKITGKKIDVLERRGRLTGERYVWGSDLMQIVQEENREGIVTALYGRGKGEEIQDDEGNPTGAYGRRLEFTDVVWAKANGDPADKPAGQSYIEIPEMTALYGYPSEGTLTPRYGVLIMDQVEDPEELLRRTWDDLVQRSRPLVTLESTVAKAGPYDLGDSNYIIRPDLGFYYEARIFEDEVNLLNTDLTRFKFGDYIPSGQVKRAREMRERYQDLTDKINEGDRSIKDRLIKVSQDWYDALMDAKGDSFFSEASFNYALDHGNEYGLPAGYYSFNAPIDENPTGFLVIYAGKIGRGEILPGGEWDFNLIGDSDGLTADAITAGRIKAQFIEIGSSSTFLEGYDPSTKANAGDVYTIIEIDTKFQVLDGQISLMVSEEVTEALAAAPIHTWIKYADDDQGTGMSDDPAEKLYLGLATGKTTPVESTNPAHYIWSLIQGPAGTDGLDGMDGEDGLPGPPGEDGVSNYTHIAYANDATGASGFSTSDGAGKTYIGMYVDSSPTDSTDPSKYTWTLIKGQDGTNGIPGTPGIDGKTPYLHIAYATNSTGTQGFSTTDSTGKTYIGQYTDYIEADSANPALYSWSLIKGQGLVSSNVQYYRSTSSTTQTGGSWLGTPPAYLTGTYLWTRLKQVWENPTQTTTTTPALDPTWGKLHELDGRTTTNESSITQLAGEISSKVSQSTYDAKMGVFTGTVSEIKQTATDITARFDGMMVGDRNFIVDSDVDVNTSSYLVREYDLYEDLIPGETYTFTVYGVPPTGRSFAAFVNAGNLSVDGQGGICTYKKYRTWSITFTCPAITAGQERKIRLYQSPTGATLGMVYSVSLTRSDIVTDYTPAPEELYTGIVRVDKDGVNVGKSTDPINSSLFNEGLTIQDTVGGRPVAEFTRDGTKTPVLHADQIHSGSIIRRQSQDIDLYVGATETGDGSGRDSSNHATSITGALHRALQGAFYLTDYCAVTVHVMGAINEATTLYGFTGHGRLIIKGETGNKLVGSIRAMNNHCRVEITDMNIVSANAEQLDTLIDCNNSQTVTVTNCSLDGRGTGYGVSSTGSKVYVVDTKTFRLSRAMAASTNGEIHYRNGSGVSCTYVCSAAYGGRVTLSGTRVGFNSTNGALSLVADGGQVIDNSTGLLIEQLPGYSPPTNTTVTKTFYPNTLATRNKNESYLWLQGEWRQGSPPPGSSYSSREYVGVAKFGSQIKDWLAESGGSSGTTTVKIAARRTLSLGYGSVSLKVGSPYALTLPAVSQGGSSSATAGPSLASAITTSSNLILESTTVLDADYAGFDDFKITVTTQKMV